MLDSFHDILQPMVVWHNPTASKITTIPLETDFGHSEYGLQKEVDTIEYNEMSQIYVIKCRGSEVEPAYRVEVEENPLEDEQSFDMNERFEKLRTAKCFDEAMTEICENSAMPQDRT